MQSWDYYQKDKWHINKLVQIHVTRAIHNHYIHLLYFFIIHVLQESILEANTFFYYIINIKHAFTMYLNDNF